MDPSTHAVELGECPIGGLAPYRAALDGQMSRKAQ